MYCKLKDLMKEKGLNQLQVAGATGLSPTIVGGLCRNPIIKRIDSNTAQKLMTYFELKSLDELYSLVPEKTPD
ncbi:MAG TPA: helix-turn-helix transcriptional regulator [Cyanophyceae cyanobacterium]